MLLVACSPSLPAIPATLAPTLASAPIAGPSASPTASVLPATILVATGTPGSRPASISSNGHLHFADENLGISFDYPGDWSILPRAPDALQELTLHGPPLGEGPEPIIFAITLDIQPVTEATVREIVDQQMAQVPTDLQGGIGRKSSRVGGEPAEEIVGLPSLGGAIETFILHKGQLYLVVLQPYDESNTSLSPYLSRVRSEYDALMDSWKFLR